MKKLDLTGKIIGDLTVLYSGLGKYIGKRNIKRSTWICRCKCGKIIKLSSHALTSGNTLTCRGINCRKFMRRVGEIPLSHLNAIKQNATKRNLPYTVTSEYLWELFLQQNRKCALSGVILKFTDESHASLHHNDTTASLDRIDCKKGYEEGNVRWVHKHINIMRMDYNDDEFIEWCRLCVSKYYSNKRPIFEEYFMMLAFDIATRSEDKHIKHGAVIVDNLSKHILGTGYNATFRGSDLTKINLDNREERRPYMIHAEDNAIMNCSKSPLESKNGASIFITGLHCISCLQKIINFGITKIYYANRMGSITEKETEIIRKNIMSMSNIEMIEMPLENEWIRKNLLN